jgi:uncharacterized repeat protein (TIGR03803 family)
MPRINPSLHRRRQPPTFRANQPIAVVLLLLLCIATASAQTLTALHNFTFADGADPQSNLTLDSAGNLYGTTLIGGTGTPATGAVFKLDSSNQESVVHSFCAQPACADGATPNHAGVIRDAKGNFYGTTSQGGTHSLGTVYKIDASGVYSVLYNFGAKPTDPNQPAAGLAIDSTGTLYGTTIIGGSTGCAAGLGCGAVFSLTKAGKFKMLHHFSGADGFAPEAGVVRDSAGNLYGTTSQGGACNLGVVFKMTKAGKETVLHSFCGPDGQNPGSGYLVRDASGNLFGTAGGGGNLGGGVVFEISAAGVYSVLYNFGGIGDGIGPLAGVARDSSGNLYGTTVQGGTAFLGVVFRIDTANHETILHNFSGTSDGGQPIGGLVLDAAGNLFGTTSIGGSASYGTLFKIVP